MFDGGFVHQAFTFFAERLTYCRVEDFLFDFRVDSQRRTDLEGRFPFSARRRGSFSGTA
jgi:hypothetical protein